MEWTFDEILQQNLYYEYEQEPKESKIYLLNINDYNELQKIRDNRAIADGDINQWKLISIVKLVNLFLDIAKDNLDIKELKNLIIMDWKNKNWICNYFPNMGCKKSRIRN